MTIDQRRRIRQPGQQVVVVQDAEPALALLEFRAHRGRELDPHRRVRAGRRIDRPQFGVGAADDLARQMQRGVVGQQRLVAFLAEVREIQIVDDVGHHVLEALDQLHSGIGVPGHAQTPQYKLAELVRGRDGGGVEPRQRVTEPLPAHVDLVGSARHQVGEQRVVSCAGRIAQRQKGIEDLGAHPLAQLLAGCAAERDQQHLVQRRHALGQIAGDQPGQGERLPGACAGFQHRGGARRRQRTEQIERFHQSRILSARSIGDHSRPA
jgi:hypothetical protein